MKAGKCQFIWVHFIVFCFLVMGGLIGCNRDPNWPGGVGNPVWDSSSGKPKIPGIDLASITCGIWNGGRLAVVIWTDMSQGTSEFLAPKTTKKEGFVFVGHHRSPDGRHADCRCATRDGITGSVTINDQLFHLAEGRLFLVSTTSGETKVRQLSRDGLTLEAKDLMELANKDQEIKGFFTSFTKTANQK
jgi:hypothetical protein